MLISDFYEDPDDVVSALSHVRGRGNDMMVFHLLDPREIDFSFADASNFIDMETGDEDAHHSRVSAQAVSRARERSTRRRCRSASVEARADYALFDTSKPLDQALFTLPRRRASDFNRVR